MSAGVIVDETRTVRLADLERLHSAELIALHFERTTSADVFHDPRQRRRSERAGYAAVRIENYLTATRRQLASLSRLTRQVKDLLDELSVDASCEDANRRRIFGLAGQRETQIHIIAICITQIGIYLLMLVRICGVGAGKDTLTPEASAIFEHFKKLRNHLEHFEQRMPGMPSTAESPGEESILIERSERTSTYGIRGTADGQISIGHDS